MTIRLGGIIVGLAITAVLAVAVGLAFGLHFAIDRRVAAQQAELARDLADSQEG